MEIGDQIRDLRSRRKMTIKELSDKTGLSIGFISNVERNVNSPTISSLQRICTALDTDIGDLFSPVKSGSLVVKKADRQSITSMEDETVRCEILPMGHKMLQPSAITICPGGVYGAQGLQHAGEEICLVTAGTIDFWAGEDCHRLSEGDCIYVDSHLPHRLENHGDCEAQTFWVTWNGTGDF